MKRTLKKRAAVIVKISLFLIVLPFRIVDGLIELTLGPA